MEKPMILLKSLRPVWKKSIAGAGLIWWMNIINLILKISKLVCQVIGFIKYKTATPKTVKILAIIRARVTDILPEGIGRFLVLFIKASRSLSITWLYALEAPTIKYPPIASNKTVTKSITFAPRKYPATEENTTLTANRILVISLKSEVKSA